MSVNGEMMEKPANQPGEQTDGIAKMSTSKSKGSESTSDGGEKFGKETHSDF